MYPFNKRDTTTETPPLMGIQSLVDYMLSYAIEGDFDKMELVRQRIWNLYTKILINKRDFLALSAKIEKSEETKA